MVSARGGKDAQRGQGLVPGPTAPRGGAEGSEVCSAPSHQASPLTCELMAEVFKLTPHSKAQHFQCCFGSFKNKFFSRQHFSPVSEMIPAPWGFSILKCVCGG